MSAPDEHPHSLRALLVRIVWTVAALAVVYVLAYGPVLVLAYRFGDLSYVTVGRMPDQRSFGFCEGIAKAYRPLENVAMKTNTNGFLNRYGGWWLFILQPKGGYPAAEGHVIISFDPQGDGTAWEVPALPYSPPAGTGGAPD